MSPNSASASGDGPTNVMPAAAHADGERGVLGEEAVAGVDAVAPVGHRGADDGVDVEVGGDGVGRPADAAHLGGHAGVQRPLVDDRVHGDRLDAEQVGRPGDADGDLAAVGDEDAAQCEPRESSTERAIWRRA